MRNKSTKPLIISFIMLVIFSIYNVYIVNGDIINTVILMSITLIPILYSFVPLLKQKKLSIQKDKYHITQSTFTDRHDDIVKIMGKLTMQEHILEIKGFSSQCGKTWLAQRLCDYINFPNDDINKQIGKIKNPYRKAYYIDMEKYLDKDLKDFFEKELVDNRTVLIFDHVKELDTLLLEQSSYHFQLVYILKEQTKDNISAHIISPFNRRYIGELQQKIRNHYPDITDLSQDEINVLYELTNGNIVNIYALLSRQESINWIQSIANKHQTEYDKRLNRIKSILYTGKYEEAQEKLDIFQKDYNYIFEKNNDLFFKYTLIKSDCEHLLNNYQIALDVLSLIELSKFHFMNKNFELELNKAHYYKHLWKCNDALEILHTLKNESYSSMLNALGILAAKYFIDDLYVPNVDYDSLHEFNNYYKLAENSTLPHKDDDSIKLKRYSVIYDFYSKEKSFEELFNSINEVVSLYKAQNNRLLANAYFIRGELNRLYNNYHQAIIDYKKCLMVTYDNNIIIQVNLIIYYLRHCKNIELNFDLLTYKEIQDICKKNIYARKLWNRINCILLNDSNKTQIIKCFDTRIMPIL